MAPGSSEANQVTAALPTIERQLAADHESLQEEGIKQLKELALHCRVLPAVLPLLPRLVQLLKSGNSVRGAAAGTLAAVALSAEGRAVLERQEGLLVNLVACVTEGWASPAAESAACSLMNIAASSSGKTAIRNAEGIKALMALVEDCVPPLEKELAQARRTSIMSTTQDGPRSSRSSSSSNPKAAACTSALGALMNLLGDSQHITTMQQAGLAAVMEKLQAMAAVDEAMAHRATFITSRLSATPRDSILVL
ncbi:hypothetical protein WJX84_009839 [Apatococcus fuscideae]|uniref:Uncharacterized protein n=1 Tax=Apatococcus fuscideae TaxID=2026836 RepID=A0AAW1T1R5_9CHLO